MATQTARLGLDETSSSENISGFPAEDQQFLGILDNAVIVTQGTLASRPTSSQYGNEYYATDTNQMFKYVGGTWILVPGGIGIQAGSATLTLNYGASAASPTTNTVALTALGGKAWPSTQASFVCSVAPGTFWPYSWCYTSGPSNIVIALANPGGSSGSGSFIVNWTSAGS